MIIRRNGLVAFPAQCNFSGHKYPLDWIEEIQRGKLAGALSAEFEINKKGNCKKPDRWFVLLDAAAFVATNELNLSKFPADFVVLSFYKMFGFPTGKKQLVYICSY
jgi:molybdenum cofactor sulfurtransferase